MGLLQDQLSAITVNKAMFSLGLGKERAPMRECGLAIHLHAIVSLPYL